MRLTAMIGWVLALVLLSPSVAAACGIPFEAQISRERALLIAGADSYQLITAVDLDAAAPDAAVVFPVPGLPTVDQPAGSAALFEYLDTATAPEIEQRPRLIFGRSDDTAGSAPAGAVILGRETIGGYDVARLSSDDGTALLNWLQENGFTLPPQAAPILEAYSNEGWSFVAVRLDAAVPNGSLAPLRISYSADQLVYPMRLGALSPQAVAVDLYLLAADRMELAALPTQFAGPLSSLEPPPPPELAALLTGGSYLTRLSADDLAPSSLNSDFFPQPAADNSPFRATQIVEIPLYLLDGSPLLACAFTLLILSSTMALVSSFYFRRRFEAISPKH